MLTPKQLHDIAVFADKSCPISYDKARPYMEEARQHLSALVDHLTHLLEEDMLHLRMVEFKKGAETQMGGIQDAKAFDAYETAQNTLRLRGQEYRALHNGRSR